MNFFEKHIANFYFAIAVLIFLNFFAWQEVFYLSQFRNLKVIFLDVGQGDAAFIITPQNHQILIDGGMGGAVLEKISKQMPFWDRSLDLVVLSHPEKDHMQGLLEVLQRYRADYILWTGVKRQNPEYKKWLEILIKQQKMGAKIITAEQGQKIKAGNALFDILHPFENLFGKEFEKTSNDTAIVAKLNYGNKSFLFTGDISSDVENQLVNSYSNSPEVGSRGIPRDPTSGLMSDVLKVAHHGSKYSTSNDFLQAAKPKIAVISSGKNNSYGHPTPEVLQRLEKFGIKIMRTDLIGDIIIFSDGKNLFLGK